MAFITGENPGAARGNGPPWASSGPLADHGITATLTAGIDLDIAKDLTVGIGEVAPQNHAGSGSPTLPEPTRPAGPTPNGDDGHNTVHGVFKPHA
jgi:hypothetical protein